MSKLVKTKLLEENKTDQIIKRIAYQIFENNSDQIIEECHKNSVVS